MRTTSNTNCIIQVKYKKQGLKIPQIIMKHNTGLKIFSLCEYYHLLGYCVWFIFACTTSTQDKFNKIQFLTISTGSDTGENRKWKNNKRKTSKPNQKSHREPYGH